MVSFRGAPAVLAAAILVLGIAAGVFTSGVPVTADPGISRVSVPKNILSGSSVTTGRTFYKSDLPENSLAGIRLGAEAETILAKWGNPSRTTIMFLEGGGGESADPSAPKYVPPSAGGGLPGIPYGSPYGNLGGPTASAPSRTSGFTREGVAWTYDLPNGITLEFVIDENLVTQITVGGHGPWSLSKTRTGIQLGDTYKLVRYVCGKPEFEEPAGPETGDTYKESVRTEGSTTPKEFKARRFLRLSYADKNRALFTFLKNRLVGITIAMVNTDLAGPTETKAETSMPGAVPGPMPGALPAP